MNDLLPEEENAIIRQLEAGEQTTFRCTPGIHSYWFEDNYGAELRIILGMSPTLIISRVNLNNKRKGTMTAILDILKQIGTKHGCKMIVAQSVLTSEMEKWCMKNHFSPSKYASYPTNEGIRGDFELLL